MIRKCRRVFFILVYILLARRRRENVRICGVACFRRVSFGTPAKRILTLSVETRPLLCRVAESGALVAVSTVVRTKPGRTHCEVAPANVPM